MTWHPVMHATRTAVALPKHAWPSLWCPRRWSWRWPKRMGMRVPRTRRARRRPPLSSSLTCIYRPHTHTNPPQCVITRVYARVLHVHERRIQAPTGRPASQTPIPPFVDLRALLAIFVAPIGDEEANDKARRAWSYRREPRPRSVPRGRPPTSTIRRQVSASTSRR